MLSYKFLATFHIFATYRAFEHCSMDTKSSSTNDDCCDSADRPAPVISNDTLFNAILTEDGTDSSAQQEGVIDRTNQSRKTSLKQKYVFVRDVYAENSVNAGGHVASRSYKVVPGGEAFVLSYTADEKDCRERAQIKLGGDSTKAVLRNCKTGKDVLRIPVNEDKLYIDANEIVVENDLRIQGSIRMKGDIAMDDFDVDTGNVRNSITFDRNGLGDFGADDDDGTQATDSKTKPVMGLTDGGNFVLARDSEYDDPTNASLTASHKVTMRSNYETSIEPACLRLGEFLLTSNANTFNIVHKPHDGVPGVTIASFSPSMSSLLTPLTTQKRVLMQDSVVLQSQEHTHPSNASLRPDAVGIDHGTTFVDPNGFVRVKLQQAAA